MTRDEAIAAVRAGLSQVQRSDVRSSAFRGFDRLVGGDPPREILKEAHEILIRTLPDLKHAIDQIAVDCVIGADPMEKLKKAMRPTWSTRLCGLA